MKLDNQEIEVTGDILFFTPHTIEMYNAANKSDKSNSKSIESYTVNLGQYSVCVYVLECVTRVCT